MMMGACHQIEFVDGGIRFDPILLLSHIGDMLIEFLSQGFNDADVVAAYNLRQKSSFTF